MKALPIVSAVINGRHVQALLDTGCSKSIIAPSLCDYYRGECDVITVDGSRVRCLGETVVPIMLDGKVFSVSCIVAGRLLVGVDAILGVDVIERVGGIAVKGNTVQFLESASVGGVGVEDVKEKGTACVADETDECSMMRAGDTTPPVISMTDEDFTASFDGTSWVVKWKWKDKPVELCNRIEGYSSTMKPETKEKFDAEIEGWIEKGYLQPWRAKSSGVIPLMAVEQPSKDKVRPVLDFRELNQYIECHTGSEVTVCDETIRKWRRLTGPLKLVDLKSAYLQLHVDQSLWDYQQVSYKGKLYCLTRVGFGLSSAPRIMTKILKEVLAQDPCIQRGTDHYVDDIIVDESVVSAAVVVDHLKKYGLEAKVPVELDGARVLGLRLDRNEEGYLLFSRGNDIPDLPNGDRLSRRQLFSICGKLVGHYPVASWLRVACSFLKRVSEGYAWEDYVGETAENMTSELLRRVRAEDPVRGTWHVPVTSAGRVWCDASSLALGIALEIKGSVVEDSAWLRKTSDCAHINVAELDAVLKGMNLALKWGLRVIEVMTDSVTVMSWLRSVLTGNRRVRTHGAAEMLIKRRLAVFSELVSSFDLEVVVTFVKSEENRADILTRVKRSWLHEENTKDYSVCAVGIHDLHADHHFGVERTLYLARMVNSDVSRNEVERCVRNCEKCQSIDPAPIQHDPGKLSVEENWSRLAVDATHYAGKCYLTMIDCGPSRFAIWREIKSENASEIADILDEIFRERGPVAELLMDNGSGFRSYRVAEVCRKWNVRRHFRAAYRPSGNGLIERHHRTVKRMAARSGASPLHMVFWYNLAPREGQEKSSVPSSALYTYSWRHPAVYVDVLSDEKSESLQVGDTVWVKPPSAKCTSRWKKGRVTGSTSRNNVTVDGMPRHVLDVRPVVREDSDDDEQERELDGGSDVEVGFESGLRRSSRVRRKPAWLRDYETDF